MKLNLHRTGRLPWLLALPACVALLAHDVCRAASVEVPTEAPADVLATDREFAQQALDSGIRAAYDHYLDTDAVVFRPLPVPAREWFENHEPASGRLEWAPVAAVTACDSSVAVTLGNWSYTAQDSKDAQTGQYLTAWRLTETGVWRIVLDQVLILPTMPSASPTTGRPCDDAPPTSAKLLVADRKLNSRLRKLLVTDSSIINVKAVTMGTVLGGARADLALTHGELLDGQAGPGSTPQVQAVYVRVWQRNGRTWQVLHDFLSSVAP